MRVLFVGDVFGKPGRALVARHLPAIRDRYDFVIANAENAAGGFGLNRDSFDTLAKAGVSAMTLGNHAWDNREVLGLAEDERLVRPLNLPAGAPGVGWRSYRVGGQTITVVNLLGRIFMQPADDPFAALEGVLERPDLGAVFVDFHAEATSEKICLAAAFDGRVAAVVGTHTHVATADTRLLPSGTAFQTDVGMTGPWHSSIGLGLEASIYKFRTGLPQKSGVAEGQSVLSAVEFDLEGDRVTRIARYRYFEGDGAGRHEGEVRPAANGERSA